MKSFFRILCLLACLAGTGALAQTAALEIISDPTLHQPFFLSVNGVRQNESPSENILVKGLPYEVYGVEIQFVTDPKPVKKVVFLRIGKTTNYVLLPSAGNPRLSEGQGAEKPYNAKALSVNFREIPDTTIIQGELQAEQFADFAAPAINFDDEPEEAPVATPAKQAKIEPVKPDQGKLKLDADSMFKSMRKTIEASKEATPCQGSVSAETVKNLKVSMKEKNSLRERYNLALRQVGSQCITVGQLKDLMRLLDGDELKVEFYKEVYLNISDYARRTDLFELFYFETSIDEIQKLK
ncbi:MAG: DUF4476 domain-containing protein [Bacteroidota bacterium]